MVMTAHVEETTFQDWTALKLFNHELALVIVPELGGKITSLRSIHSGREWLWANPHLSQSDPNGRETSEPLDYIGEFDTGGWDEVFPTVEPCRVTNTAWGDGLLTDHGEIWRRRATFTTTQNDSASVCLQVDGDPLPFTFQRTVTLQADARIALDYQLTNHADKPLPYIWAAHPLVRIEPGMRIELPKNIELVCSGGVGPRLPEFGEPFAWPMLPGDAESIDLRDVPQPNGLALKLFTQPLDTGWVAITSADRTESFRLSFANTPGQRIGLWLNYGGWSGCGSRPYVNAGIEPTTSPCDKLSDAIAKGLAAVALPGETNRWALTTTLTEHERDQR